MRCSNTYAPGLSVHLSGHNGTFCVDIIDRRTDREGDVYRIATARNANVAYGLYQYIRVADSIVVKMIFESSKG